MKKIIISVLLLIVGVVYVGCHDSNLPTYKPLTFTHLMLYRFDVSDVSIAMQDSTTSHDVVLPVSIENTMSNWARHKIQANGARNLMKVAIQEASITKSSLPMDHSTSAVFKKQHSELYEANLIVNFEIYGADLLFPKSEMKISVNMSRSVLQDMTLNEKQDFLYNMISDLMVLFNKEFDKEVSRYFNNYLM